MKDQLRVDITARDVLSGKVFKLRDEKLVEGIQKLMEWHDAKYGDEHA